jgi:histidinol-phosphate phosphatase family protein
VSARAAVFLDRDGTIIEDTGYVADPAAVRLLPGAAAAIARLNRAGLPAIVVTNQSGIARGLLDEAAYAAVARRLESLLGAEGARLDGDYYCPHHPDFTGPCECRKPGALLYCQAAAAHGLLRGTRAPHRPCSRRRARRCRGAVPRGARPFGRGGHHTARPHTSAAVSGSGSPLPRRPSLHYLLPPCRCT